MQILSELLATKKYGIRNVILQIIGPQGEVGAGAVAVKLV